MSYDRSPTGRKKPGPWSPWWYRANGSGRALVRYLLALAEGAGGVLVGPVEDHMANLDCRSAAISRVGKSR